jgi:hypothetical protein
MDGRMGTSSKTERCKTCDGKLDDCNGHFGHVKLALPVYHVGYFRMIISVLQEICKVGDHQPRSSVTDSFTAQWNGTQLTRDRVVQESSSTRMNDVRT